MRQARELKYYIQSPFYLDGYNEASGEAPKTEFIFFAVEKTAPYPVNVFQLDQPAIARGRSEYTALLNLYLKCRKENNWPTIQPGGVYSTEVKTIGLPRWMEKMPESMTP
jgi:exodeoxyribonuclease VIII